jgi:hypothetical protein
MVRISAASLDATDQKDDSSLDLPGEFFEQRLGVLQVGGVETLGRPVVNVASIARASSR